MSKQQRSGCSPRFETLEQKQLLAGDVTYEVVNGNLHLLGDAESNEIVITAGDIEGSYLVQGLNGTTISPADGGDGSAAPVSGFVVEGVTRNVRIDLGDGDDTV
ncbi:MAG: hypothetical protein KDA37_02095, partial [Planctomycetales bacterium]|nr:hypothetical protein [Planctomycetales bacterium]